MKTLSYFPPRRKKINFKIFTSFWNNKISNLDITIFFRQLATLISAGIPIVQSLEILRQSQEKLSLQTLILSLKQQIESGKTLMTGLIS
jgi:type IV pilus assembly protein PilC